MGCSHNCDSCSSNCGGEKSLKVAANPAASVKKVIGVVSGKLMGIWVDSMSLLL